jgi:cellulose synthase/poly-beta-1,6-N-acetylglucosamine synthase-like glycosyltransferase
MRASVIVPTAGNRPDYLRDALDSLLRQDVPSDDYEVLVVDNGSRPAARAVVEEVNRRAPRPARYVRAEVPGLHEARHAGAREAGGEVLVFVDDDVIVHDGWLGAMLAPFRDIGVAFAGGKVLARWEGERPQWYSQFNDGYLSLLDEGDRTLEMTKRYVWGCNMAVRKAALYELGGFAPDGFADRRLIWLRGDGECGPQRRGRQAGRKIIYEPRAWLYHRIPPTRLTPEYMNWRFFTQGITESYSRVRRIGRRHLMSLGLVFYAGYCLLQACRWYLRSLLDRSYGIRAAADAWYWFGKGQHSLRTALSANLREHVLADSYL